MKLRHIAAAIACLFIAFAMTHCATTRVTTTGPDGSTTTTETTQPGPGVIETAGYVAGKIVDRSSRK